MLGADSDVDTVSRAPASCCWTASWASVLRLCDRVRMLPVRTANTHEPTRCSFHSNVHGDCLFIPPFCLLRSRPTFGLLITFDAMLRQYALFHEPRQVEERRGDEGGRVVLGASAWPRQEQRHHADH